MCWRPRVFMTRRWNTGPEADLCEEERDVAQFLGLGFGVCLPFAGVQSYACLNSIHPVEKWRGIATSPSKHLHADALDEICFPLPLV